MSKLRLIKGERLIAGQTLRIDNRIALVKGRFYMAKNIKAGCCKQKVDIGYMHHQPIASTCADCGFKSPASKRVWIPASYFRRATEPKDKVTRAMEKLEKLFKKLG